MATTQCEAFSRIALALQQGGTRADIAQRTGYGEQMVHRAKVLLDRASADMLTQLRQGTMSINRATATLDRKTAKRKAPAVTRPFAATIRAEVRARIEVVRDEVLTLEQLAHRWDVHPDIARRYLREVACLGEVVKTGDLYTITLRHDVQRHEVFMERLDLEIIARRKEADGGYNQWRVDGVHTLKQSKLLDWIQDEVKTQLKTTV